MKSLKLVDVIIVEQAPENDDLLVTDDLLKGAKRRMLDWVRYLDVPGTTHMINVLSHPQAVLDDEELHEFGLRILNKFIELDQQGTPYRIIGMGSLAYDALMAIRVEHFMLPHPYDTSKRFSSKELVAEMLNECYAFIHEEQDVYDEITKKTNNERKRYLV